MNNDELDGSSRALENVGDVTVARMLAVGVVHS